MAWMENHFDHAEPVDAQPGPKPKPTARDVVLGIVVVALFALASASPPSSPSS